MLFTLCVQLHQVVWSLCPGYMGTFVYLFTVDFLWRAFLDLVSDHLTRAPFEFITHRISPKQISTFRSHLTKPVELASLQRNFIWNSLSVYFPKVGLVRESQLYLVLSSFVSKLYTYRISRNLCNTTNLILVICVFFTGCWRSPTLARISPWYWVFTCLILLFNVIRYRS